MQLSLRGLGDGTVQALYPGSAPITCPAGFQVQPITPFVNTPDEPAYMAPSNWKCTSQVDMNIQSGRTYGNGLKIWTSGDFTGILMGVFQAPLMFPTSPGYALGILTPVLALLGLFMIGGKK
jgi:hypothetical protein